mmetsp:Transcript_16106/g.23718  ORF Transcript_16106/g.23718 Transcript_16106/m.23718 type:complete len:376 (-) Transcript_16106:40-1167(-)|eukprot:CAMPEP_0116025792 /NCGR_PEP_ID=MMETSP0321-20121206/13338_1 /TAXON_ID=163516 /ORGANISM="Leptocylindrus danicus var. danicus, Strain B650" /LENGTH=375 /DNA_ID=CAMNT_0003498211 /DNA_START=62 /DNA_END=1189 /DNA_ORIENTATION=-
MTYYLKSGSKFKVSSKEDMDLHETLPVATYTVHYQECSGQFYLDRIDDFEIKGKIYGKTTRHADRILRTFASRSASTGVLLTGEKGSGKTLLAKKICIDAAAQGIPTLVINQAWVGEQFNAFIQMINLPTVVIFDEFEKVYDMDEQEQLLTLLDGVYPSKKLFLLTCNNQGRIDSNFLNRPGRIFYAIKYEGLDSEFIREYCEDNLNAKEYIPQICSVSSLFAQFNFDILKAMVEEMNRYGESPSEVLEMINAQPENCDDSEFQIQVFKDGKRLEKDNVNYGSDAWNGNPMCDEIQLYCETDPDNDKYEYLKFTKQDLHRVHVDRGEYVFVNNEKERLILKRLARPKTFNYNVLSSSNVATEGAIRLQEEKKETD